MDPSGEITPFSSTPDPRLVYPHRQFDEALGLLERGIDAGKGFLVVTGEVGAGKTTLMRTWLSLHGDHCETAVILNTGLDADGLLLSIADDLGAPLAAGFDRKSLVDAIHEKLLATAASGRTTVLFIDEAQNLSIEALELLRMLSNLETEREKLVQIVLMGQDSLRDLIALPELTQLKSRIAMHRHLRPLSESETGAYVRHRLEAAGCGERVRFSGEALRALHEVSGGVPRRINILADIAFAAARDDYSARSTACPTTIETKHVMGAANEFQDLEPERREAPARAPSHLASTAAAWAILVAVLGIVATRDRPQAEVEYPASIARDLDAGPDQLWDVPAEGALNRQFTLEANSDTFGADVNALASASSPAAPWLDVNAPPEDGSAAPPATLPASQDSRPAPASLLPNSRGEAVVRLQNDLFRAGCFRGVVNGFYGPTTVRAVVEFQRAHDLSTTGIFDPPTSQALATALER
jgi:general secretion pathway protein A